MSDAKNTASTGDWRADVSNAEALAAATERERQHLVLWIKARLLTAHPRVLMDALLMEAGALAGAFAPGEPKEMAVRAAGLVFDACREARAEQQAKTSEVH